MGFLRAVRDACLDLKGSFAIEVITDYFPDNMIVVRKDSPLVIGTCDDEKYISSDIPAILSFTRDFYLLNDLEFVLLSRTSARFFDSQLNEFQKILMSLNGILLLLKKMVLKILCLKKFLNNLMLLEKL